MSKRNFVVANTKSLSVVRDPTYTKFHNHSDFVIKNTKTGVVKARVPQTSMHRYVNDYGWDLTDIVNWRTKVAPTLVRV